MSEADYNVFVMEGHKGCRLHDLQGAPFVEWPKGVALQGRATTSFEPLTVREIRELNKSQSTNRKERRMRGEPVNWRVTTGVATIVGAVAAVLSILLTHLSIQSSTSDAQEVFVRIATQCLERALQ